MKQKSKGRFGILVILLLLFIAPGLVAVYMYTHPDLLSLSTSNKGRLMKQTEKMIPLADKPQWAMIFWAPKGCDERCLLQLDKLASVRLALGRRYYDVDEWLLLDSASKPLSKRFIKVLKDKHIDYRILPPQATALEQVMQDKPAIFIISPERYFVLSYPEEAPADDIYQDIKHLLSNVESRGASSHVK